MMAVYDLAESILFLAKDLRHAIEDAPKGQLVADFFDSDLRTLLLKIYDDLLGVTEELEQTIRDQKDLDTEEEWLL